ncbi:unnamed protein product [Caenorhabditis sp. 36 PRJEB53466]|nr:unnamed protein product [Caenorhabditis sp. 36 PRJEB53466]
MLRTILISLFLLNLSRAGPLDTLENAYSKAVECAVCQFFGASTAGKTGASRAESIAHCLRFEGCEQQQSDCEIVATLHSEIEKMDGKFGNAKPVIENAVSKCAENPKALVIGEDPSSTQCMLCFLVYDVLKYINYNILENPMLADVKVALESACILLNEDLCQALLQPDSLGAIIRGLQDSLGGFYDLIAVQGFGCPAYNDLFGKC